MFFVARAVPHSKKKKTKVEKTAIKDRDSLQAGGTIPGDEDEGIMRTTVRGFRLSAFC